MLANFMAPQVLKLRINAQVMLIKNVDETLVNGSVGKVIAFHDQSTWTKVQMGMTVNEDEQEIKEEEKAKKKAASVPRAAGGDIQLEMLENLKVMNKTTRRTFRLMCKIHKVKQKDTVGNDSSEDEDI